MPLELDWHGPASRPAGWPGSEATVQARSGLMEVHGRDAGAPRRLGYDVASVAAGILASTGLLAAATGRARGRPVAAVQTSVLQAALVLLSHYFVVATALGDAVPGPPLPAPGPPFRSADGVWFEIETLDPEAWKALWTGLGAGDADLGQGWTVFRWRYERAACSLPVGLHEATGRHSFAVVVEACRAAGVSVVALRDPAAALLDPGLAAGSALLVAQEGAGGQDDPSPAGAGDLPLAGVKVVEATSRIQGPLAGMLLRMLGAGVVRVQPPEGDYGRAADTLHRDKAVLPLDLGRPAGRDGLRSAVADADVFLHNWRPGKAEQWGLAAGDLAAVNRRLVYAAASGWGPRREAGDLLGTDFLVQAWTGLGAGLAPEGEPPFPARMILCDLFGAVVLAEGIVAALYRRAVTGRRDRVDSSLVAGAMALRSSRPAGRPAWGVLDRPVATVDGAVVVTDADGRVGEALGLPPGSTPEVVAHTLAGRPAAEWEDVIGSAGIPCVAAPPDLAAVAHDPRLAALFEPVAGGWAPRSPWAFA